MRARIERDAEGRRTAVEPCTEPCPIERGMRVLGGKWTGSILWHLQGDPVRFNDLARMVGGASRKMISERLRFLEAEGLIRRNVMSTSPVSVEYSITDHGRSALIVLETLRDWSEKHTEPQG